LNGLMIASTFFISGYSLQIAGFTGC
jgi:hypothetical protein